MLLIILNTFMGFLYTPTLVRFLGIDYFAIYILLTTFVGYLALTDFGINGSIVRFISKFRLNNDNESQSRFLGALCIIYFFVSIIILILSLILYSNFPILLPNYHLNRAIISIIYWILVLNLLVSLPFGILPNLIEGFGKFSIVKLAKMTNLIFRTISILILFNLNIGFNLLSLVIFDLILTLTFSIFYLYISLRKLNIKFIIDRKVFSSIREIFEYSFFIFILALVNQFYWRTGNIVLSLNGNSQDIASHSISMLIINNMLLLTPSLSQILFPKTTSLVFPLDNNKLSNLMINVGKIQFGILFGFFFIFLLIGKQFILLWLGSGFESVYFITIIYLLSISLQSNLAIGTNVLKTLNLHKYEAYIYFVSSILFIFISFFSSRYLGIYGIAFSSFICLFLIQGGLIIKLISFKLKIRLLSLITRIFKSFSIPFLILILLHLSSRDFILIDNWAVLIFYSFLFGILYIILFLFFTLNKQEKITYKQFLFSIFKKKLKN